LPGLGAAFIAGSDGSYLASFRVQAGAAGAATVRIAARDSGGRVNATKVTVTVGS
jgi:hypothetical protein